MGPLFLLAPPRSLTSVAGAMLAQHPQLYTLPETHLMRFPTVGGLLERHAGAPYPRADGAVRAVAQLVFGEQSEENAARAAAWLEARADDDPGAVLRDLADRAAPAVLIEKCPSLVFRRTALEGLRERFPDARYLHLTRHPKGYGNSVLRYLQLHRSKGQAAEARWLLELAAGHAVAPDESVADANLDPQRSWYGLNDGIEAFLGTLPADRTMRMQGEALLSDPEGQVRRVAAWLGLRTDDAAVAGAGHPERWPFAGFGPKGAAHGVDLFFLVAPQLRPARAGRHGLDGPVDWRGDGSGLHPAVRAMAERFGYR